MNVFIIGSPLETAKALDKRRLNKQIIECLQILNAIMGGAKAWRNHPCTLQYKNNVCWLDEYFQCLVAYRDNHIEVAKKKSLFADSIAPSFHTQEYFDQMKRRLFTKDSKHYAQWAHLGTSEVNWYFIEGEWRYYENGKRINI